MEIIDILTETQKSTKKYWLSTEILEDYKDLICTKIKVPKINELIGTIYMFINKSNGKIYIGQTYTKYYERFGKHFVDTFTRNDSLYFHNALRKYGWNTFNKYILWQDDILLEKTLENKKLVRARLDEKEMYYIELFKSNDKNLGYNLTLGGSLLPDSAFSTEAREKAIKTQKEHNSNNMLNKTYEKHHLAQVINQYSLNGDFIKSWPCIKLAEDTLNISINTNLSFCGDYIWIKPENYTNELLQEKIEKAKVHHKDKKLIYRFDLYGELIDVYNGGKDIEQNAKVNRSQVFNTAKQKEKGTVVHNSIWIYEEDLRDKDFIISTIRDKSRIFKHTMRPIIQIFLNGDIINTYENVESLYKEYPENSRASLNKCLNKKSNMYNNCIWIYEDEYSEEEVENRIEACKKRHKTLVNDIINGKVEYDPEHYLKSIHITSNKK